jgi:cyclic pyranopterin phosphate synthase
VTPPQPLVDSFGRQHRDLRISITDRCNFRCTYCMPVEGMQWQPRDELLTYEEITRITRVAVERFGFDRVRITGGEPTVRAHLPVLVEKLAGLGVDVALTTNGASLGLLAHSLADAGLDRINISCDSLRADRFERLTRRDSLGRVLEGIDAALDAGLHPVKVNAVLMRGVNDDEVVDFAAFARDKGVAVRFIEYMPLDADQSWQADQVVSQREIVDAVSAVFPLVDEPRGSDPAQTWSFADGAPGQIGVIASVTEPFCGSCDRVRLTSDGKLRSCLFALDELDLRAVVRGGGDDEAVAAVFEQAVGDKWAGHAIGQVQFIRPSRSMSQIGG